MVSGETPARLANSALLIIAACRSLRTLLGSVPARAFDFDFAFLLGDELVLALALDFEVDSTCGASEDEARESAVDALCGAAFGSGVEFEVMAEALLGAGCVHCQSGLGGSQRANSG
jgi:hypothetical protein